MELVEDGSARPFKARLPEVEKRYHLHGAFKVGFRVEDLDAFHARLAERGADFYGGILEDSIGERFFLVNDPDGNRIQLFAPAPDSR